MKPHLRLHFRVDSFGRPLVFPWQVEYVRGSSKRHRFWTGPYNGSSAALRAARSLWFRKGR